MKSLFFCLTFIVPVIVFAGKTNTARVQFDYSDYADCGCPYNDVKNKEWEINRVKLSFSNPVVDVLVNLDSFDSIAFLNPNTKQKEILLTRLSPAHKYVICLDMRCGSFDLMDTDKSRYPKGYKRQYPDTLGAKVESGTVRFLVKNAPDSIFLVGAFGDITAGYISGLQIKTDSTSKQIHPFWLPNSDFNNELIIGSALLFDSDTAIESRFARCGFMVTMEDRSTRYEACFTKEYLHLHCRFFNRENLLVIYDYKTGKTELQLN